MITDGWIGYNRLKDFYKNYSANHSKKYIDPNTGATTNSIEGLWNGVKHQIKPLNRSANIRPFLSIYIWRRKNKSNL